MERQSSSNETLLQEKYLDKNVVARFANRRFFQAIRSLTSALEFHSVLDAGCGEGTPLSMLTHEKTLENAVGMDLDPRRLHLARQAGGKASYMTANAQRLPFPDRSFDLLMSLETLEHVGYPEQALEEYARVTRRHVLLSVPHEPWWRLANMARLKYLRFLGNTPGHINHWTSGGFGRLVGRYFNVIKVIHPFLWTFVLAEKM